MYKRETYLGKFVRLPENGVFVFGSNTQGRHGKGAAAIAKKYFGAIQGVRFGRCGMSYAIVTKDLTVDEHPSIPRARIEAQIEILYNYAKEHPHLDFYVAYSLDSNLNGYTPYEMSAMFACVKIPKNIIFEAGFAALDPIFNSEVDDSDPTTLIS